MKTQSDMIGKFAISKAGHDTGKLYVIVDCDGDNVYLADGDRRSVSSPKKKNRKHVQIINETVGSDLLDQISLKKKNTDTALKYVIKQKLLFMSHN